MGAPNNLGLDPFPDPVGNFWAPWRPFWISRTLIGRNTDCSDQKTYFAKVVRSALYYYREVISVFWFGGSKTRLPSPVGGRQAKVDRSAQVTIEKWPPFFDLGSVSWPQRRCRRCSVAGGAALQAVSECPRRRQAGILYTLKFLVVDLYWGLVGGWECNHF